VGCCECGNEPSGSLICWELVYFCIDVCLIIGIVAETCRRVEVQLYRVHMSVCTNDICVLHS